MKWKMLMFFASIFGVAEYGLLLGASIKSDKNVTWNAVWLAIEVLCAIWWYFDRDAT
jgi:hypothetical protein